MPRRIIRNAIHLDTLPPGLPGLAPAKPVAKRSKTANPKPKKPVPERYRLLPGETSDQRAARLQRAFDADLRANGFAPWEPEHKFALKALRRKWAMDRAWPQERIAVEIEGYGHQKRNRYYSDLEKYNAAAAMGWLLVRVTYEMIADDSALALVKAVFAYRQAEAS